MKKIWNTELVDSTIGDSLDEAGDISGDALKTILDNPHGEFGTAGTREIDSSQVLDIGQVGSELFIDSVGQCHVFEHSLKFAGELTSAF